MGGSQSLSKEVLSNRPLLPPLKNLLVMIEIPDRCEQCQRQNKELKPPTLWSRHQNYGAIFFFFPD